VVALTGADERESVAAGRSREDSAEISSLDLAYHRIREAILTNELKPGSVISQVKLAEIMGVSRTPLREAIRLLQYEGLVEAEHNRRVLVSQISVADLEQLYALRISNEALAIRLSVPAFDAEDDAVLKSLLLDMAKLQSANDVDGWGEAHSAFHHRLIYRAGARITKLIDELSAHAERYRRTFISQAPRAWSDGEAEHAAIANACFARDGSGAAALLARHLGRTALTLLMNHAPEYEPALVRSAIRSISESV
jgi:DNA-binding GntR family transcriptional regulator